MDAVAARLELPRVAAYGVAGGLGTSLHYLVVWALWGRGGLSAVAVSTCGAVAGAMLNYVLAYRTVFRSNAPYRRTLGRFATTAVIGVALNAMAIDALLPVLGIAASQAGASVCVFLCGYTLNRNWSFRE